MNIKQVIQKGFVYLQRNQLHRKPLFKRLWHWLPDTVKNKVRSLNFNSDIANPISSRTLIFKDGKYVCNHVNKLLPSGINIVGFAKGDFGLAEHCRLTTYGIKTTPIKFCLIDVGETVHAKTNNIIPEPFISKQPGFNINLLSFNADTVINYVNSGKDKDYFERYNIGYGYWELSEYPNSWLHQNNALDEIWAPSRYVQDVIAAKASIPVVYMPIAVDFTLPNDITRSNFNLPENKFLFLFSFDMSSFVTRKNPMAAIDAFLRAFSNSKNQDVLLVIKINWKADDLDHQMKIKNLYTYIKDINLNILIIDKILDRRNMLGLINCCNCYISLHRSEGFGLGMAEAMKMGKVVIGTNYSGNTDFMHNNNACLVDYKLMPVGKKDYCFVEEGALWAEADIEQAAFYMRKVVTEAGYAKALGIKAKQYMDENHNFAVIGKRYQKRLTLLGLV